LLIVLSICSLLGSSLLGCSPLVLELRTPIDIDGYEGDGLIARIPNALNPGFSVDFEPFLLNAPLTRSYAIDRLPRPRHHSPYQVVLVVDLTGEEDAIWPLEPSWMTTPGVGTLAVRVISNGGTILVRRRAELSDLYWERFANDMPFGTPEGVLDTCHDDWYFPSSQASDAPLAPAILEVSYIPGPGAVARSARIRVMAGGRE
jgi:hypothetical protein